MKFDVPTEDEYALIFDSWAASFKKSPWAGCVTNDMWADVSRRTMQDVIDRPGTVIECAVMDLPDGDRRVMGYVVAEPANKILHWLYVKRDYRGMGVGTALLDRVRTPGKWRYTHRTNASERFLGKQFTWDPVPSRVRSI